MIKKKEEKQRQQQITKHPDGSNEQTNQLIVQKKKKKVIYAAAQGWKPTRSRKALRKGSKAILMKLLQPLCCQEPFASAAVAASASPLCGSAYRWVFWREQPCLLAWLKGRRKIGCFPLSGTDVVSSANKHVDRWGTVAARLRCFTSDYMGGCFSDVLSEVTFTAFRAPVS